MLTEKGFNLWADRYDETVQVHEETNTYPFAGYREILNSIFTEVMAKRHSRLLDIGFGTGVLTSKLYENGHQVDGIDFSERMIEIAQAKMPNANLMRWDVGRGLPQMVKQERYDSIISTYALHHLTDSAKVEFIQSMLPLLTNTGRILIGDVAFQTRTELERCRMDSIGHRDDDEFYFVFEELKASLEIDCVLEFSQVSHCGGVIAISRVPDITLTNK